MIKILFMDADGTLTDGKIYIGENGELFKAFNIKDGYGIKTVLKNSNILSAVITGRESPSLKKRCEELDINYLFQGVSDKLTKLKEILTYLNIDPSDSAYIGDDDNDLDCIEYVSMNGGIIGCPSNSSQNVLNFLKIYKCNSSGGEGAVREFIEYLIKL